MSRTSHHRIAALIAVTLLLAGCGAQSGSGTDDSGTVSPSPRTSEQGCTARAMITVADSGSKVCLTTGEVLRISLDGTPARPWAPVAAAGSALEATNSGIVLQPGDASAAFEAVSAGSVRLTTSRPLCPADPSRFACEGVQEWWVTVVVT